MNNWKQTLQRFKVPLSQQGPASMTFRLQKTQAAKAQAQMTLHKYQQTIIPQQRTGQNSQSTHNAAHAILCYILHRLKNNDLCIPISVDQV